MLSEYNDIEEDEEVIFEGNDLYEHLSALGYVDFETATVSKPLLTSQKKSIYMNTDIINDIGRNIYRYILDLKSWITQDCSLSKEQLHTILSAKTLLDDHAYTINSYTQKYFPSTPWKKMLRNLLVNGTIIASSAYLIFCKHKKALNIIITFCILYFTGYRNYKNLQAHKELKQLVLLQNEFYDLCNKGLKILRHGYKVKINSRKVEQPFHDLMGERLIYLQPIMENLIKCMEDLCQIYHHIICIMTAQFPKHVFNQFVITTFEDNAFKIHGEINYEALKQLYYTYALMQSELLYLLAIAYDTKTWSLTCDKISKANLIYITYKLNKQLIKYKNKLSLCINSYYNCKVEPVQYNFKGPVASKWQDVYLHLNLTSNKIQQAYERIISMINDIDTCTDDTSTNNEMIEKMTQKMDEMYKQIDTARNFAEFSSLLITKIKYKNSKMSYTKQDTKIQNVNENLPVIIDTEPEILDEVFEEYIKEEYLKPLYEEDEEILLQEYKLDKLLAKNFMSELKEALIDKHRTMSERESKALQRMYRNVINSANDLGSNNLRSSIPIPPPMPSLASNSISLRNNDSINYDHNNIFPIESSNTSNTEIFHTQTSSVNNIVKNFKYDKDANNESIIEDNKDSTVFRSLSLKQFQNPVIQFGLNMPPQLLSMNEEMFIGSGENSESDIEPEDDSIA
ncbi:uncharacterized protein V1477_015730 [Vespula maculifrons]|uniref:Vezatin n=2 Tax=Vespula TaxID=7451 RepID=A0A834N6X1_VESVU|nr:uncharacterized protein LOC127064609 isoform X3 [Vespula vulgaris]KAF7398447.1 hypothetical protein HZH66_006344 [Vespula vulgaris]